MANDFLVQRGVASIPLDTASVTITAGTEYTAPSSTSAAFLQIISSSNSGASTNSASDTGVRRGRCGCYVSNPTNLLTSITFTRGDATSPAAAMRVSWEIWEYIGAASGANEFIVREQNTDVMGAAVTTVSNAVAGVVTTADVVIFVTGQMCNTASSATNWDGYLCTGEYTGGNAVLTRINSPASFIASWAAVEFTGSNWTVQRISHTFSAVDTDETETLSDVGSLTRTFTHAQMRNNESTAAPALNSYTAYVNSTTQATFHCTGSGVSGRIVVLWVVSNSQTTGTPMVVQRVSATRAAAAATPWNDTITAVAATNVAALTGITSYSDDTTASHQRGYCDINPTITNTTTVENSRGRTAPLTTYRYEVTEFPTVPSGIVPILNVHRQFWR